jgi:hypothetical protein
MSGKPIGENLNALNLYAVLTIMSFALLLPVSLGVESPAAIQAAWNTAIAGGTTAAELIKMVSLSGM